MSSASPSSRRSTARGGYGAGGAVEGSQGDRRCIARAREAPAEHRGRQRVEVRLTRQRNVEAVPVASPRRPAARSPPHHDWWRTKSERAEAQPGPADRRPTGQRRRDRGAQALHPGRPPAVVRRQRRARGPLVAQGSSVRAAERSRNAPAAAIPPRACARAAERSRSAAMSSSGRTAACARCHARRSGSFSASVASASAPWTSVSSAAPADR